VSYDGSWPPPADDPPPDRHPPDGPPPDRPSFIQPPFVHLPPEQQLPGHDAPEDGWPVRGRGDHQRWAPEEQHGWDGGSMAPYGGGPPSRPDHAPGRDPAVDPGWPGLSPDRTRPARVADEPPDPQHRGGPRRTRVRVAAAGLVVAGIVAALAVRQSGGGGAEPGSSGDGWEAEQFGNSQMLAADREQVCSVTSDSLVYCLDPATGEEVFSRQLYLGVLTSPVLADGGVLLGGSSSGADGTVFAYSADGGDLWEAPLVVTSDRPLLVVGDVVAVVSGNGSDGALVGLDAGSGAERWRSYNVEAGSTAQLLSPRVFTDGNRLYVAVTETDGGGATGVGHVVAVDPASGQEIWRSPAIAGIGLGRSIASAAPFADGSAAAFAVDASAAGADGTRGGGRVVVLDSATGAVRWEVPTTTSASVAHIEGLTIAVDGTDMRAYDSTGGEVWEAELPVSEEAPAEPAVTSLVVEGGRLFGIGRDVYAIDPTTGASELVAASGTTSDVAVAGDSLVIASVFAVSAVPLGDLPFGEHQETVVTG
jgi:outer membrane protein assembly factor BamB